MGEGKTWRRVIHVPLRVHQALSCGPREYELGYFAFNIDEWWGPTEIGYKYGIKSICKAISLLHEYGHYMIYCLFRFVPDAHLGVQELYDVLSGFMVAWWDKRKKRR